MMFIFSKLDVLMIGEIIAEYSRIERINEIYNWFKVNVVRPKLLFETTFKKFSLFKHESWRYFIWKLKVSELSNLIPRNVVLSTCVIFESKNFNSSFSFSLLFWLNTIKLHFYGAIINLQLFNHFSTFFRYLFMWLLMLPYFLKKFIEIKSSANNKP